jgi:hypothetical protein
MGERFYNQDRWTGRELLVLMCTWAEKNPGCVPTRADVSEWVKKANNAPTRRRMIVIANTPDKLPLRTAMGLVGGAYHEAFHSLYSCRRQLNVDEATAIILPRWAKVPDWSRLPKTLLDWSNIIEDTRIEKMGREEFEPAFMKLADLQDYIIIKEKESWEGQRSSGKPPNVLSVVSRTFRDVGLGYNTDIQRAALEQYKTDSPEGYSLVMEGPLTRFLRETVSLGGDDLGCIRLAMDIIAELVKLSKMDQDEQEAEDGQAGDGKTKCPQCGADGHNIIVRPKSDGNGGKIKGVGIATCTVCGWQDEVKIKATSKQAGSGSSDPKDTPQFVGFDVEDFETGMDPGKDGEGKEKGEEGKEEGKGKEGGSESDTGKEQGEGKEGEGEGTEGEGTNLIKDAPQACGAGGHHQGPDRIAGNDWSEVTQAFLQEVASGADAGLQDLAATLAESVKAALDKELSDVNAGEAPWNPLDLGLDTVQVVLPSHRGKEWDLQQADSLLASVKPQTAYLRARLRMIVQAMTQTAVYHGVKKGRNLSGRFLADTHVAIMGHNSPNRAYYTKTTRLDMSMAAAIVMDQSGSMHCRLGLATQIFCALTEPLDSLGCPTLAIGFRNGERGGNSPCHEDSDNYHRTNGVTYDIFKGWNERFRPIRWRFANTRADGGTPMADGIQFAMTGLKGRTEANRFLFVVTDGGPDPSHAPVVRRQCRIAKGMGIHIIGVGVGDGAEDVVTLFPDHVWSKNVSDIPRLLVAKLNDLVDIHCGRKRNIT